MEEKPSYAVPFSLVGFFITDKPIEESIRSDLTPEELEYLQDILRKFLFTEGVRVAIYPSVVPPDQAMEAIEEMEDGFFQDEDD